MKPNFFRVSQGTHSKLTGEYISGGGELSVDDMARLIGHGIAEGPFDEKPSCNFGSGVYRLENGKMECVAANWDSSD